MLRGMSRWMPLLKRAVLVKLGPLDPSEENGFVCNRIHPLSLSFFLSLSILILIPIPLPLSFGITRVTQVDTYMQDIVEN